MVWKTISATPGWQKWESYSGKPIAKIEVFSSIDLYIEFLTKEEGRAFCNLFKDSPIPVHPFETSGFLDHKIVISQVTPYLNDFFHILLKFDPSITAFLPELLKQLKLPPSLGLNIEQLKVLPKDKAIFLAKEAQDYGSYDLIWELFNLYENDYLPQENPEHPGEFLPGKNIRGIQIQELYDLANSISGHNVHYKEAQALCASDSETKIR